MNPVKNTIRNLILLQDGEQWLRTYYETLQYVTGDGHYCFIQISFAIFATRESIWFILLSPSLTEWTRTILVDYMHFYNQPNEYTLLLFVMYLSTFEYYHLLYIKCFRNKFSELPYRVICLKQFDCFQTRFWSKIDSIRKFYRINSLLTKVFILFSGKIQF